MDTNDGEDAGAMPEPKVLESEVERSFRKIGFGPCDGWFYDPRAFVSGFDTPEGRWWRYREIFVRASIGAD